MKGVGNGSCRHASLNFLKSTHILISPCFLSYTTIRLIHYDSSTSSMIPSLIILLISTLIFCLYIGFNLYGYCMIDLASGLSGIFISPSFPKIPFISLWETGHCIHAVTLLFFLLFVHPISLQCWPYWDSRLSQC
jgi:hypothetical protein